MMSHEYPHDGYYRHLCICGKSYVVRADYENNGLLSPFRLFTEKNFPKVYKKMNEKRSWWNYQIYSENDYLGKELPVITEISKQINQPVFMIDRVYRIQNGYQFYIDHNIPILKDYDIPSLISAKQMYQELSYYFINTMHDNPDTMPPSPMTDKEKTLQHGFDIKQSFRHRK